MTSIQMNMRKAMVLWLFMTCSMVMAQDPSFSQYYSSSLYLNPALAGAERDIMFSSNYRTQWRSLGISPFTTSQVSMILPYYTKGLTERHVGGAGFSMFNDRAGDGNLKTLGVNLNAAYNLPLSFDLRHEISLGIQAGFIQKSVDYTNLQWGQQYNPYVGFDATVVPNEPKFTNGTTFADVGAGFVYYYNADRDFLSRKRSAFFGASFYHLNKPNESFVKDVISELPMLIKAHGGFEFPVSQKMRLSPNALVMFQNNARLINGGLYANYRIANGQSNLTSELDAIFGVWYRLQDSFIFSAGIGNRAWTVGFSYDYNNSNLRYASKGKGAYEISLTLRQVKKRALRRIETPRI